MLLYIPQDMYETFLLKVYYFELSKKKTPVTIKINFFSTNHRNIYFKI